MIDSPEGISVFQSPKTKSESSSSFSQPVSPNVNNAAIINAPNLKILFLFTFVDFD